MGRKVLLADFTSHYKSLVLKPLCADNPQMRIVIVISEYQARYEEL